jgi:hypothetical protein
MFSRTWNLEVYFYFYSIVASSIHALSSFAFAFGAGGWVYCVQEVYMVLCAKSILRRVEASSAFGFVDTVVVLAASTNLPTGAAELQTQACNTLPVQHSVDRCTHLTLTEHKDSTWLQLHRTYLCLPEEKTSINLSRWVVVARDRAPTSPPYTPQQDGWL